ncbi:4,5-dihydroxyphthalate decarboxylase [Pseudonocardia kunmingensis]|uniref:4,5-dihydroxyphthalate decarboxylase n=1 Tax=Pseudonocardia kunmingensis TaxID=630975 RepID=A0A543DWQ7_9PSEU|nr:4,5-dihydroxyphthalate decarboxylase [Pseudonocardia kunmingensis]
MVPDVDLHLGTRHWDHVVPIALGDVSAPGVRLSRLDTTPDLWSEPGYAAAETSFSRYVRARADGDNRVVGLPVFLMRGFRHRCILVRRDSAAERPEDLVGARIGLTGWPDSGNTWTRAVLREAGVGVDDAQWRVGPLTAAHPAFDRIGGVRVGPNVRPTDGGAALVDLLETGELDAVMTPFMPPGFHRTGSPLRTLFRAPRSAEQRWFDTHGFVPGIHLLGVRADVLAREPGLAQELVDLFEAAKRVSAARRTKLVDVSPWLNEEVAATTRVFGSDWMPYGWSPNRRMIAAFQEELVAQRLLAAPVPDTDLFPFRPDPAPQYDVVEDAAWTA